jgi:integrase
VDAVVVAEFAALGHETPDDVSPSSAEHVQAAYRLLATRYKLPLLVLDASGMRVGELEALTWADIDEQRGRWRVSRAVAKTRNARFVSVLPVLFERVLELCPCDDRHPEIGHVSGSSDAELSAITQLAGLVTEDDERFAIRDQESFYTCPSCGQRELIPPSFTPN